MTAIETLQARVNRTAARYARAKDRVAEEKQAVKDATTKLSVANEAQTIVQAVAQGVQQQAHDRIASIVTRCLKAVFTKPYTFKIRFERKRGKTEAILTFLKGGNEITPTFGSEGGVLDVASFALRLACLSLTKLQPRKLLVLDEPARGLHGAGNRERFRELIETLPKQLGFQVVMVTGLEWLQCGDVVEMGK